jgi:hypothetical protein
MKASVLNVTNSSEGEREESMTSTSHRSNSNEDTSAEDVSSAMAGVHHGMSANPMMHRITELELENSRLQKLVAELLLKNQQLRRPD